jgi:hypothetical protein
MVGHRTNGSWESITMSVALTTEQIVIDRIKIDPSKIPDEEIVRQLMISLPIVGLLQPIILCRPAMGLGVKLVFGLSRITAAKRLKWRAITSRVVNGDTEEIRAWCDQAQHDENMIRRFCQLPADPAIISLSARRIAARG